jgi:uncharacterized coiled-coil protein SlyX
MAKNGIVTQVTGSVIAINASGVACVLRPGDRVFEGDIIQTADGSTVKVEFEGLPVVLGRSTSMLLDTDFFNVVPDAKAVIAEQVDIAKMIAEGKDLTTELAPTAAGSTTDTTRSADLGGGHSFVVVAPLNGGGVSVGYETATAPVERQNEFVFAPAYQSQTVQTTLTSAPVVKASTVFAVVETPIVVVVPPVVVEPPVVVVPPVVVEPPVVVVPPVVVEPPVVVVPPVVVEPPVVVVPPVVVEPPVVVVPPVVVEPPVVVVEPPVVVVPPNTALINSLKEDLSEIKEQKTELEKNLTEAQHEFNEKNEELSQLVVKLNAAEDQYENAQPEPITEWRDGTKQWDSIVKTSVDGSRVVGDANSISITNKLNENLTAPEDVLSMNVTYHTSMAGYHNTMGYVVKNTDGTIAKVDLLWKDVKDVSAGTTKEIPLEDGQQVGFFILSNQASYFESSAYDSATMTLSYNANQSVSVMSGTRIVKTISAAEVFDTFDSGNDKEYDAVAGVKNDRLYIGFDDQQGGDNDFNDVVISVQFTSNKAINEIRNTIEDITEEIIGLNFAINEIHGTVITLEHNLAQVDATIINITDQIAELSSGIDQIEHVKEPPMITDFEDSDGKLKEVKMSGTGDTDGNTITVYDEDNHVVGHTTIHEGRWEFDVSNLKYTATNDNEFFHVIETHKDGTQMASETVHYWHGDWSAAETEDTDDYALMGSGNDTIYVNDNDLNNLVIIDGGHGTDKAILNFNFDASNITRGENNTFFVKETNGDINELRNIETFQFNNKTLSNEALKQLVKEDVFEEKKDIDFSKDHSEKTIDRHAEAHNPHEQFAFVNHGKQEDLFESQHNVVGV